MSNPDRDCPFIRWIILPADVVASHGNTFEAGIEELLEDNAIWSFAWFIGPIVEQAWQRFSQLEKPPGRGVMPDERAKWLVERSSLLPCIAIVR